MFVISSIFLAMLLGVVCIHKSIEICRHLDGDSHIHNTKGACDGLHASKGKHGHGKCGSHHAHDHGEDQHHAPCSHEVVETDYSLISYSKEGQLIAPELAVHLFVSEYLPRNFFIFPTGVFTTGFSRGPPGVEDLRTQISRTIQLQVWLNEHCACNLVVQVIDMHGCTVLFFFFNLFQICNEFRV